MTTDAIEMTAAEIQAQRVATQNDTFRKTWGADFTIPGRIVTTQGVASLPFAAQVQIMVAVQTFDTFTEDNDPHGTHEMGFMEVQGEKVWWRIDLYNRDYTEGSSDPTSLAETRRVLTVLFPSDY